MPYSQSTFLCEPVGNNAFAYDSREIKQLYIGALKKGRLCDVVPEETHPAFFEVDETTQITQAYFGLKNFIATTLCGKEAVIFDNHNHAFYFWLEAYSKGLFDKNTLLFHIDEHSDLREPPHYFAGDTRDMQQVADYTNNILNVGNYIKSATNLGLFDEVIRVQGESELDEHLDIGIPTRPFVLNIDLDFWSKHMEYIPQSKKDALVHLLAPHASFITIATSPFFISTQQALDTLHRLFDGRDC